jgi:glutaminyl-peptide cyclotransferase
MKKRSVWIVAAGIVLLAVAAGAVIAFSSGSLRLPAEFSANRAYADVTYQLALGPRIPGSTAHAQAVQWIVDQLKQSGWQVDIQQTTAMGHPVQNVIAKKGNAGQKPWMILGTHYDSRMLADRDPNPVNRTQPVPGANDGASGVAVLLEIARVLNFDPSKMEVWLVFFDAEDQGDISGWDWILGSQAFVDQLKGSPDAVIVIDMIGDKNLDIYKEKNSNVALTDDIWSVAASLGYQQQFISQYKYSMEDDHTPFLTKGLPAIDIIDFDYPYWHTISDTADKVSGESLKVVGDTLLKWITSQ